MLCRHMLRSTAHLRHERCSRRALHCHYIVGSNLHSASNTVNVCYIKGYTHGSSSIPSVSIASPLRRTENDYHFSPFSTSSEAINDEVQSTIFSPTDKTTTNQIDTSSTTGEECYNLAMEAVKNAKRVETEEEERQAAEQFEAMKRAHEKRDMRTSSVGGEPSVTESKPKTNGKAAGVAVVRTIVKQTRKKQKEEIRNLSSNNNDATPVVTIDKGGPTIANNTKSAKEWKQIAMTWLEKAAYEHGHPAALVRLGNNALEEAKTSSSDVSKDMDCANETEDGAKVESTNEFEQEIKKIRLVASSLERAGLLYQLAGKRGSAEGWFNLGHLLWTGHSSSTNDKDTNPSQDLSPDREASLDAFQKAIDLHDPDAMYFVGVQYLWADDNEVPEKTTGIFTRKRREGLDLVQKAGKLGHGGALHHLALLHRNGDEELNINPCDAQTFKTLLDRAADGGDADALYLRAHCYFHGEDGYNHDPAKALDGFLEAAEAGHADAAVSAGAMLHRGGFGGSIVRDRRRAFELYQEAAELGSIEGWRNLVSCYALGEGVPRCEETASYIARTMLKEDSADSP